MINVATIVGNVGRDPEIRQLPSGKSVLSFSLACNEIFKDAEGKRQQRTHWVRCTSFGKIAEVFSQYLAKGKRIGVSGPLNFHSWKDSSGRTNSTLEIRVQDFAFLDNGYNKNATPQKQSNMATDLPDEALGEDPDALPF